jgi:GntR family transcriptional regulator
MSSHPRRHSAGQPSRGEHPIVREPLYARIASQAEARIRGGEWAPGDRLPPERELCRDFVVSRATLRQALGELEERGLVSRHQGRGTFVARHRVQTDLDGFFSYGEALRARGMSLVAQVLSVSVAEAGRAIATELGILPGDPVVHLERVRAVDAEALILETTNLPAARFPGLETQDFAARSLYQILREDFGCEVETAIETLEPVILTPGESHLLGVPRNAPALMIRRVTTDSTGLRVELTQALLRGDRTRFLLQRRVAELDPVKANASVPATPFTAAAGTAARTDTGRSLPRRAPGGAPPKPPDPSVPIGDLPCRMPESAGSLSQQRRSRKSRPPSSRRASRQPASSPRRSPTIT